MPLVGVRVDEYRGPSVEDRDRPATSLCVVVTFIVPLPFRVDAQFCGLSPCGTVCSRRGRYCFSAGPDRSCRPAAAKSGVCSCRRLCNGLRDPCLQADNRHGDRHHLCPCHPRSRQSAVPVDALTLDIRMRAGRPSVLLPRRPVILSPPSISVPDSSIDLLRDVSTSFSSTRRAPSCSLGRAGLARHEPSPVADLVHGEVR